jgi:hypothetical protein
VVIYDGFYRIGNFGNYRLPGRTGRRGGGEERMSELVTEHDIKNWREYFAAMPQSEVKGIHLFIQSCFYTIGALRAELSGKTGELKETRKILRELLDFVEKATIEYGSLHLGVCAIYHDNSPDDPEDCDCGSEKSVYDARHVLQ